MRRPRSLPVRGLASILVATGLFVTPLTVAAAGAIPERIPDQAVYDVAGVFSASTERTAESILDTIHRTTGSDVVVLAEGVPAGTPDAHLAARAATVREALGAGAGADGDGLLVYVAVEPSGCRAGVVLSAAPGFPDDVLDQLVAKRVVEDGMQPLIAECDLDHALLVGLGRILTAITVLGPGSGGNADGSEAGPPFPEPIDGVRVYDHAGAFRAETIAVVAKTIAAIEDRTGAQVVVYSQVVESGRSTEEADADARSLMDQWGVGRKGFDDGLVILFDLYPGLDHGQVILYGGPGYRAAFLDNADKQRIYEEDMLPRLRAGDMDGALLVAIDRVDANATPEHAQTLETARQVNAVVGLVGGPLVALGLIGTAAWAWLRFGRDPVYLDDPSIHMAGPPEALTPAAAVFVLNGGPSRRALTTALLDLASRGVISFREEKHLLGIHKKVGIETRPVEPDPATAARQARNRARDLGPAEALVERRLGALDQDDAGYVEPDDLPAFAAAVPAFDKALEREVVARGWFAEPPSKAIARWTGRAALAGLLGGAGIWAGASLPSSGLLLVGVGAVVGAVVMFVIGLSMPAVSLPGAMIRAMLAAYRRTLKKTMEGARSMDQVVDQSGLTWLETPDQAVVWGTALGLGAEIETVLGRSLEDAKEGRVAAGSVYLPAWYGSSAGGGTAFASDGEFAGASAGSGGIFSSSAIPDFGGMMSALGSIGSAPGSSGSGGGGGGGFGGGGSGGGGGGSGGGF